MFSRLLCVLLFLSSFASPSYSLVLLTTGSQPNCAGFLVEIWEQVDGGEDTISLGVLLDWHDDQSSDAPGVGINAVNLVPDSMVFQAFARNQNLVFLYSTAEVGSLYGPFCPVGTQGFARINEQIEPMVNRFKGGVELIDEITLRVQDPRRYRKYPAPNIQITVRRRRPARNEVWVQAIAYNAKGGQMTAYLPNVQLLVTNAETGLPVATLDTDRTGEGKVVLSETADKLKVHLVGYPEFVLP